MADDVVRGSVVAHEVGCCCCINAIKMLIIYALIIAQNLHLEVVVNDFH